MKLDLKRLFDIVGERLDVSGEADLSWIKRFGQTVIPEPVKLEVHLVNRASVLTLDYDAWVKQPVSCDRCLKSAVIEHKMHFNHTVVRELNQASEQDGYLVAPDGIIDMGELAATDIQLELPNTYLCKEDCKGLCSMCGADLNKESCGCTTKTVDPRLEVLKKLL